MEVVTKTIPKKKRCKRAKWLSEEGLQIAEKRGEAKGKGERERYAQLNVEFQRRARSKQFKQRKTIKWERLEISLRKLEVSKKHFLQR